MTDNNKLLKPDSPTRRTVQEIIELYPTVLKRGWTKQFLVSLVEHDVIGGDIKESDETIIFEESFKHFLDYHDSFYQRRIALIDANLQILERNRGLKAKQENKKK